MSIISSRMELHSTVAGYAGKMLTNPIDCQATAGAVIGIIGENGIGKSALLKSIAGVIPLLGGSVLIDGFDVTKWPAAKRVQRLGLRYLAQRHRILESVSVRENLHLATAIRFANRRQRENEIASLMSTMPFCDLAPFLDTAAAVLSGGQNVLLGLAAVLLGDPRILLLDEPTSGLSEEKCRYLADILKRLGTDRLVVVSEQNLEFLFRVSTATYVLRRDRAESDRGSLCLLEDGLCRQIRLLYEEDRRVEADNLARSVLVA